MEEISVINRELSRILETIESGAITPEWRKAAWGKASRIATQASTVSRMVGAIEKLAVYAIYTGELWKAEFPNQEEWIGDLNIHLGMGRGTVFGIVREINMARQLDKSWQEIAAILSSAPTAMRDASKYWLDEDGEIRGDLTIDPSEALDQLTGLSPTEARAHVRTIAGLPNRFVSAAAYHNGVLFISMVIEEHDKPTRELDIVITASPELDTDDAKYLARRLGGRVD